MVLRITRLVISVGFLEIRGISYCFLYAKGFVNFKFISVFYYKGDRGRIVFNSRKPYCNERSCSQTLRMMFKT